MVTPRNFKRDPVSDGWESRPASHTQPSCQWKAPCEPAKPPVCPRATRGSIVVQGQVTASPRGPTLRSWLCSASTQHGPTDLILFLKGRQPVTGELLTEMYLPDAQRCTQAVFPHRSAENISNSRKPDFAYSSHFSQTLSLTSRDFQRDGRKPCSSSAALSHEEKTTERGGRREAEGERTGLEGKGGRRREAAREHDRATWKTFSAVEN
ncbi:unnamed protein product [Pleuronectes platessa]|uniref:Uncharacterized protein n=1 Tax=Pleuronectes platessa TaxID=8262 RepID=A0A9N7YH40_PLEPL|nr:unnamed protein product [Pleuronectes platessa]